MRAFKIIAPKESGQSDLVNWIRSGADISELHKDLHQKNGVWHSSERTTIGGPDGSVVVGTFERGSITDILHLDICKAFHHRAGQTSTVVISRDPFNCAASYFQKIVQRIQNGPNEDDWDSWGSWRTHLSFWKSTHHLAQSYPDIITIDYNRWLADPGYRETLAKRLRITPTEPSPTLQTQSAWESELTRNTWRSYVLEVRAEATQRWPELAHRVFESLTKVPEKEIEVLLGPFGGEFGCELMFWQGHCRKLARTLYRDRRISIATRQDRFSFYQDITDRESMIDVELPVGTKSVGFHPRTKIEDRWKFRELKRISDCYPDRPLWKRLRRSVRSGKTLHQYFQYGRTSAKPRLALIHVRTGKLNRKWGNHPIEHWHPVVQALGAKGLEVAVVGSHELSAAIPNTIDLRGIALDDLMEYLSVAYCVIGTCSGPLHLASLCGTSRIISWGLQEGRVNLTTVNPFRSKIFYRNTTHFPKKWLLDTISNSIGCSQVRRPI